METLQQIGSEIGAWCAAHPAEVLSGLLACAVCALVMSAVRLAWASRG
jgi:hypothetical protein